jgi:hypothetical protein
LIRTLEDNSAAILIRSNDDRKTTAETAYNEMVMQTVWALWQFNLHVRQQNHLEVSLRTLDNALKRFYQNIGIFREQKMLKSAMPMYMTFLHYHPSSYANTR